VFEPSAKAKTSILFLQKGVPHPPGLETLFVDPGNCGMKHSNKMVVELPTHTAIVDWARSTVLNEEAPDAPPDCFFASSRLVGTSSWLVGANLPWDSLSSADLLSLAIASVDNWAAGMVRYAVSIRKQRAATCETADIATVFAQKWEKGQEICMQSLPETFGSAFTAVVSSNFTMGNLLPGGSLVVTASMYYNGIQGAFNLSGDRRAQLLVRSLKNGFAMLTLSQAPPFLTITSDGTPGLAFVQTEPCAVLSTCLVAVMSDTEAAKFPDPVEKLAQYFLMAATISCNKHRFSYAYPCKFKDISSLPLPQIDPEDRSKLVCYIREHSAVVDEYIG